ILQQAATHAKGLATVKIRSTGHADRSGSDAYNMRLSQRRADAVKAELVRLGLKASDIAVVARGEANPLVPKADGVREPQNRRVEIVFE
ncbi:MAG: OmpA family protein, partial [Alphaproteobacteria bacterium]|nr:OmpA family protein [Alphaproteobacteria bacterium]